MPLWPRMSSGSPAGTPPEKSFLPPPRMQSGVPLAPAARTRSMMSSSAAIVVGISSEARKLGMRQRAAAHQLLAVLGAARERGNHLARIERALGIEGALDAEH